MNRSYWLLPAIAAAAVVLSACGTTLDTADVATGTQVVIADSTETSPDATLLTPEYWEESGGYEVCFVMAPDESEPYPANSADDFELTYTPDGYVWKLIVVSQLGEPENTHHLFEDPVEGDVFATGGYDQVIGCKNMEPEPEPDPEPEDGCSFTQGYWKTHSEYGPAPYDATWALLEPAGADTDFYLSGVSYYDVLHTPTRGNAYYILAHQYIAALLNQLGGADTSAIEDQLTGAHDFFESHAPSDALSRETTSYAKDLAETLDAYNNGLIGPGHCG